MADSKLRIETARRPAAEFHPAHLPADRATVGWSSVLLGALVLIATSGHGARAASVPFINELHYDNVGGDVAEGVEIAAFAGTDLSAWSLVFYNGSNGSVYGEAVLSGVIGDQQSGFGTLFFETPGLQNGPDGIALVSPESAVIQFLSYEGSFLAVDGPAAGLVSEEIAVSEAPDTPIGLSLQLAGIGAQAADFAWAGPVAASPGQVNVDQLFRAPVPLPGAGPLLLGAALSLAGLRRPPVATLTRARHERDSGWKVQRSNCQDSHSSNSGSTTVSSRKLAISATT